MRILLTLCLLASLLWPAAGDDARITANIRQKLSRSKLRADGVRYQVKDGVVEWTGTVPSPQRKGAATRMAKSAGAKRVVNHLTVAQASQPNRIQPAPRKATVLIPKQ